MLPLPTLWQLIFTLAIAIAYTLYYLKYHCYSWIQKDNLVETKNSRGKSLPCFPNGWFKILNSDQLKKEEVKYVDYCGRNLAVFRGTDNKVYAIEAYCAHMGANLALGGTVKFDRGLQCPFHGWVYDGATGNCVIDGKMGVRTGDVFDYHNKDTCEKVNGSVLKKECNTEIKVKKYVIREFKGQIFCWFHADDSLREKPLYEPITFEHGLQYRGESLNFVNTHIQDIPENGADLKHFFYVHTHLFRWTKAIAFRWKLKWTTADDPNLYEIMHLEDPKNNAIRKNLLDNIITPENKKYLSIISIQSTLVIFGFPVKFFTLTGFQLGPGTVSLYLNSPFFTSSYQQAVTPTDRYQQRMWHRIYTNSWTPYWMSSFMLWGEVQQVMADLRLWNNKKYNPKLTYDLSTEADNLLYRWRNWYGQFYDGCAEMEKELYKYDW